MNKHEWKSVAVGYGVTLLAIPFIGITPIIVVIAMLATAFALFLLPKSSSP